MGSLQRAVFFCLFEIFAVVPAPFEEIEICVLSLALVEEVEVFEQDPFVGHEQ